MWQCVGAAREDVRIVDSSGQSHHAGTVGTLTPEERLENVRQAELYFVQRIRQAVVYVDRAVVVAEVSPGDLTHCRSASVSVPRSYLASSLAESDGAARPDGAAADWPQLAKVRQAAMRAIGTTNPADVTVDWYYDQASPASATAARAGLAASDGTTLAGLALGACVTIIAIGYLRRRRSARSRPEVASPMPPAPAGRADEENRSCALGLLAHMDTDSLIEMVRLEHPQTIAVMLAHLDMAKAAAVLSTLGAAEQVDVSRRMAAMEKLDPQVVADVERSLAARLAGQATQRREESAAGVGEIDAARTGAAAVAQMLQQAGYATSSNVLAGLTGQEPALADSIRRQMFSLEDLVALPDERLRAALEGIDDEELSLAFCAAGEAVKSRVYSAIGSAAARRVRQAMVRLGPVRLSDVESAQETILEALRRSEGLYVANSQVARSGGVDDGQSDQSGTRF